MKSSHKHTLGVCPPTEYTFKSKVNSARKCATPKWNSKNICVKICGTESRNSQAKVHLARMNCNRHFVNKTL